MNKVTGKDIAQIIRVIKTNFDNAYRLSDDDFATLVESWKSILSEYPREVVLKAARNVISEAETVPRIGHIVKEIKRLNSAMNKSGYELWNELLAAIDKAADLARKFKYTYREANGKTQGENARNEAFALYDALDPAIKAFCGNISGLIQLSKQDEDQLLFERSRFLKSVTEIRERIIIRREYETKQLACGFTDVSKLIGGEHDE